MCTCTYSADIDLENYMYIPQSHAQVYTCNLHVHLYLHNILLIMYIYLEFSALGCNEGINWNEQHHHHKPSEDGESHGEIEEDKGQYDLERSRPDHVEVAHQVHESLGVH